MDKAAAPDNVKSVLALAWLSNPQQRLSVMLSCLNYCSAHLISGESCQQKCNTGAASTGLAFFPEPQSNNTHHLFTGSRDTLLMKDIRRLHSWYRIHTHSHNTRSNIVMTETSKRKMKTLKLLKRLFMPFSLEKCNMENLPHMSSHHQQASLHPETLPGKFLHARVDPSSTSQKA
ncbi:hypothetical protein DNTS_033533 [Danionella cerebrum]|uniref:Uncharacterized protein n=1 Tax=Danionella cerebrum TaxID=2873325 RepID=A0A553NKN7_9TELE|nr:hypothetical protein DNTS_033533 [Danionella translucida]